MNREAVIPPSLETLDHADKSAWRERQGWCSPQEAMNILTIDKGPRFELIESEAEPIP